MDLDTEVYIGGGKFKGTGVKNMDPVLEKNDGTVKLN